MLNIGGILYPSFVDGKGVRCVVFFSGCSLHCKGCHNEELQDVTYGIDAFDERKIQYVNYLLDMKYCNGLTISGGEPMEHAEEILQWLSNIKLREDQNIWLYTGYTLDGIRNNSIMLELARKVDYIVAGPYIESLRNTTNGYYGSINQKIYESKGGFREWRPED